MIIKEKGKFKNMAVTKPGAYFLRTIVDNKCGSIEFMPIIPTKPR